MNIVIRDYKQSDKEALIHCMESLQDHLITIDPRKRIRRLPEYGEKYVEDLLKKTKEQEGWIGLAEYEERIIGCIAVIVERKDGLAKLQYVPSPMGDILELYVDPNLRSKGIGAKLMEAAEQYLRSKGCDAVNVEVFVPNERAHEFYKKCGYEDRSIWLFKLL
ncbi:GNAT family N-acetyltransferase [Patescibacteria group bacterium]|nr:GNAT family N-acetyltransferase [Patescibacteria group bacterium]MBU2259462.1 GNAT family N-acetyltransferase [Patescibacteria group bacterium]